MVQLGWKAGPEQFPPAELLDYAVAAEKAGFDLIDVSDHFNPWSEAGQAACISSNADDHVKFAQQYIDLGFDRLFFHSALPNQDTFIERFASDVLSRLR